MTSDPEPFVLVGTPKKSRALFPDQPGAAGRGTRQTVLFCGLDDSPGQADLFPTDGQPGEMSNDQAPMTNADPRPSASSAAKNPPVPPPLIGTVFHLPAQPAVAEAHHYNAFGIDKRFGQASAAYYARKAIADAACQTRDEVPTRSIHDAEAGDVVCRTRKPVPKTWLLFMKQLTRDDARRIAREENGRILPHGNYWAVLVPELAEARR